MNEHEQNTFKLETQLVDDGFIDMSKLVSKAFNRIIKNMEAPSYYWNCHLFSWFRLL